MAKKTNDQSIPTDDDVRSALERVLSHAEGHGEVYVGATDDHALLRATVAKVDSGGESND